MRRVLLCDAVSVARVLLALAPDLRPLALRRIWAEAGAAEAYRRRTGRMHPIWGDGSLSAAALRRPAVQEPRLDDTEYLDCLIAVLTRLRADHPRVQDRQRGTAGSTCSRSGAIASPQSVQ